MDQCKTRDFLASNISLTKALFHVLFHETPGFRKYIFLERRKQIPKFFGLSQYHCVGRFGLVLIRVSCYLNDSKL